MALFEIHETLMNIMMRRDTLRTAMINHHIPADMTVTLTDALGIVGVEDLADMPWSAVLRTPEEYHQRIMDLRNRYKRGNQTMWTFPSASASDSDSDSDSIPDAD
jgi:hypothetical protein